MSVLERILAATREEIARLRTRPGRTLERSPIDVFSRMKRDRSEPLRLVAEIKKRSPSAGAFSSVLSVDARARAYERSGASMVSVLVDRAHFDGSYDDLLAARAAIALPLLCKGFVLDEVQIEAARESGADAVLLIARILDDASLARLLASVRALRMTPVVEVVDEREIDRALSAGADVLGVNARDLDTLVMDPTRAARVVARVPDRAVALFFSGLSSADEVARVAAANEGGRCVDGALIGEALMRRDDPSPLLGELISAAARGPGTEAAKGP